MEHLKNLETEVLGNVLSNLADIKYAHTLNIQMLVDEFPQSGLFRALLAGNGNEQNIKHAAAYFSPAILHKIVNSPGSFPVVTQAQIFKVDEPLPGSISGRQSSNSRFNTLHPELNIPTPVVNDQPPVKDEADSQYIAPEESGAEKNEPVETADITHDDPIITHAPTFLPDEQEVVNEDSIPIVQEEEIPADTTLNELTIEDVMAEALAGMPVQEDTVTPNVEEPYIFTDKTEYFQQDTNDAIYDEVINHDIEDEVYDEIVSIEDINLVQLSGPVTQLEDEIPDTATIAADDHFTPEPKPVTFEEPEKEAEIFTPVATAIVPANEVISYTGNRGVSMYNDEKMPYTFMWWLDKTRKDHDPDYQPYASTASENVVDELQQQYVEHIFSVNGIEEIERGSAEKIDDVIPERKKDKIIKRFIEAEPQIKHAGGLRLNNENKAKKSSEDGEEMVTETLARIYTEQMLYPKAIAAYKKLMLKFPEKSLYFAGQIEQLEKKPS